MTACAEAVRLAKRIVHLEEELADNRKDLTDLVSVQAPGLLELPGISVPPPPGSS